MSVVILALCKTTLILSFSMICDFPYLVTYPSKRPSRRFWRSLTRKIAREPPPDGAGGGLLLGSVFGVVQRL